MKDAKGLLIEKLNELHQKADNIEHQLEMTEARQKKEANYIPDPVWKAKARYALKATRREVCQVQEELSAEKRDFNDRRKISFEQQFIDVSRTYLDPATYDHILQKACEAVESSEQKDQDR